MRNKVAKALKRAAIGIKIKGTYKRFKRAWMMTPHKLRDIRRFEVKQ